MNIQIIAKSLTHAEIPYALVDEGNSEVRILISEDNIESMIKTAAKMRWRRIKDRTGDLYLYGMKRFLYFAVDGKTLVVCCQLACRSTLNNGWVPLDKQINGQALSNLVCKENLYYLSTEDELCYLTAKCVYTEKVFCQRDIERIEACMSRVDRGILIPKLERVFFKFTGCMLRLLERKEYDDIIASLLQYAAY